MGDRGRLRRRLHASKMLGLAMGLGLPCGVWAAGPGGAGGTVPVLERVKMADGPASILLPVGWTSQVRATGASSQSGTANQANQAPPSTLEISVAPVGDTAPDEGKSGGRRRALKGVLDAKATLAGGVVCAETTSSDRLRSGACARWFGSVMLVVKLSSATYQALGGLDLVKRVLTSAVGFRNVRTEDLAEPAPTSASPTRPASKAAAR